MEYLKIAKVANEAESKKAQISEYYRVLGANPTFSKEAQDILYGTVEDMKKDLTKLETKLKQLTS